MLQPRVGLLTEFVRTIWTSSIADQTRERLRAAARWLLPRRAPEAPADVLQPPSSPAFYLGMIVISLGLITSFSSYMVLTRLTPIVPNNFIVSSLLVTDGVFIAVMLLVVALQVYEIVRARLKQTAGARLHWQIVQSFSLIAVAPAILLALFSTASLNRGLDGFFSWGTENIIKHSEQVAQAYLKEHGQVIQSDVLAMTNDLEEHAGLYTSNPEQFKSQLTQQAQLRNLPGAYVINAAGDLEVASALAVKYAAPPDPLLKAAISGDIVIVPPLSGLDQVGALQRLPSLPDAYLYVVREVDGQVIEQLRATQQNANQYRVMKELRATSVLAYGLLQGQLALTMLLSAVWAAMWFANWLVSPIRRLIGAAQLISQGNLDVRVPFIPSEGDLGNLADAFNTMTGELKKQRDELVSANGQLSERGRFIEAVLSGVTAGVIGLDASGRITLANRSALQLLGRSQDELTGHVFGEVLPELAHLLDKTLAQSKRDRTQEQVDLTIAGAERHFIVQVTREHAGDRDYGFVVTVDDITGLVTAQRTSAWADVARRIAHEIKNPLTPIQLSAERLRRKYGPLITTDRDIFDRCTDTIIRQVGDIGRIVDEFSSFARMPKAQMELQDVAEVTRQAVDLFQLGRADIEFKVTVPPEPVIRYCDRRLLSQAITNLIKNATEAVQAVKDLPDATAGYRGLIEAEVTADDNTVTISIIDNGCGLPKKDRNRLVEPYMTTRAKGTGIGLAVVNRVTEQHGGTLVLEDAPLTALRGHGAAVRMVLPLAPHANETPAEDTRLHDLTAADQAAE